MPVATKAAVAMETIVLFVGTRREEDMAKYLKFGLRCGVIKDAVRTQRTATNFFGSRSLGSDFKIIAPKKTIASIRADWL